jgi:hypothetical protein
MFDCDRSFERSVDVPDNYRFSTPISVDIGRYGDYPPCVATVRSMIGVRLSCRGNREEGRKPEGA